jgi:hypothetical protein
MKASSRLSARSKNVIALGTLATTLAGAAFGIGYVKGGTSAEQAQDDGTEITHDAFESTTTTLPDNLSEAIDNVTEEPDRPLEFTAAYPEADAIPTKENPGVIKALFGNFEKSFKEKNPQYLEYYYYDITAPDAQDMVARVESLPTPQNHLVVETSVEDSLEIDDDTWVVRVTREFRGVGVDGEVELRDLTLKRKVEFFGGEFQRGWFVSWEKEVVPSDPIQDWSVSPRY